MQGYDSRSYGAGFADVYDEWYADVTDVEATVTMMHALAGDGGSVLELGVGTGRLALPMAEAGLVVAGIDSSEEMLQQLRQNDADTRVEIALGDMITDLPDGPFDAALIAYNTIFNLLGGDDQAACFEQVARRLRAGGRFVVEAFVPNLEVEAGSAVSLKSMTTERVVLSVSNNMPADQRADGQFIEFTESGGVRLRPWSVRWSTPDQLDAMAAAAGLALERRTADMAGTPFDDDSAQHVSVYRRDPEPGRRLDARGSEPVTPPDRR